MAEFLAFRADLVQILGVDGRKSSSEELLLRLDYSLKAQQQQDGQGYHLKGPGGDQNQGLLHLSWHVLSPEPDRGVPHGVRPDGARLRVVLPRGSEQPVSGK